MRKKILIDLRFLKNLYYGFGQLCLQYGNYLQNNPDKIADLDITVLVPKEYIGKFGDHIKYLETKRIYKTFPFLAPRYDVWHSITQTPRYFSINESCSRIITIHDLNFLYEKTPEKAKKRLKRLQENINICDLITVISHFTLDEVKSHLDVKVPIIVNYVGLRDISNDKSEKPVFIKDDRKFFFTIGQVVPKKNFHTLVGMMELMPEYDLYICGQDHNEYSNNIKKEIEQKQLKNVFVTGPISAENKIWMYKNCYGFTFPSKFEGFGMPIIEAMRFDKPVFSSKLTSLKEVGNKYAYFWDNFEPEHMKRVIEDNIEQFYNNPELIKEQREYSQSYSLDRHFEAYLDTYRQMPEKKRSILKTINNFFVLTRY